MPNTTNPSALWGKDPSDEHCAYHADRRAPYTYAGRRLCLTCASKLRNVTLGR
jgi:hypothetical protein